MNRLSILNIPRDLVIKFELYKDRPPLSTYIGKSRYLVFPKIGLIRNPFYNRRMSKKKAIDIVNKMFPTVHII